MLILVLRSWSWTADIDFQFHIYFLDNFEPGQWAVGSIILYIYVLSTEH